MYSEDARDGMRRLHEAIEDALEPLMPFDLEAYFTVMSYRYVAAAIRGGLTEDDCVMHCRTAYQCAADHNKPEAKGEN